MACFLPGLAVGGPKGLAALAESKLGACKLVESGSALDAAGGLESDSWAARGVCLELIRGSPVQRSVAVVHLFRC